jgi:predicted AAA+ superfamily ATPase
VYCIDTGLRNIASFQFSEDTGKLVENMVFLELKRRGKEIYYWSGKGEGDFVVKEGLHVIELIRVCWNIYDTDKKNAELKGLIEAMDEFNLNRGLMITEDSDLEENIGEKKNNIYATLEMDAWDFIKRERFFTKDTSKE